MTLTDHDIEMIRDGLELPSEAAIQAMREEINLKSPGFNTDILSPTALAREVRMLRGVRDPDSL
ncbi:MAG: hypothetical protein WA213_21020 [Terriglobales bacterium]